jgi:hypothetical protein
MKKNQLSTGCDFTNSDPILECNELGGECKANQDITRLGKCAEVLYFCEKFCSVECMNSYDLLFYPISDIYKYCVDLYTADSGAACEDSLDNCIKTANKDSSECTRFLEKNCARSMYQSSCDSAFSFLVKTDIDPLINDFFEICNFPEPQKEESGFQSKDLSTFLFLASILVSLISC